MASAEQPSGETGGPTAAEPLLAGTDYQVASEVRTVAAESATAAIPWPPPTAFRLQEAVGAEYGAAGDDAFAAAILKPPPEGPFPTAAPQPEPRPRLRRRVHVHLHVPALSAAARRRAALVGAPLLLFAVVGGSLFASGAFAGAHQSRGGAGAGALGTPGSGRLTGLGSVAGGLAASQPAGSGGTSAPATGPASGPSAAPGSATPGQGGGSTAGGSSSTTTGTTGTSGGGATTPASSTTTRPPTTTDTGWVCRVGGFDNKGGFSEDPCIRDDNGTLMLEGELKGGTYASAVVVVVRVDYGGTLSSANVSKAVTPSGLGGKTFVYEVTLGRWTAGEVITCEENVDPAASPKAYQYTSNSGDIRTFT